MVQQTDYHGWDLPEVNADEDKWGDYIRNTFQANDEETVKKDLFDNRPAAGSEGRWFLATDRMTLYYDNGASWDTIVGQDMPNTGLRVEELVTDAGSATSPAYTFNGDTDTGIYSDSADELSFATGGTEGLRIESDQHTHTNDGMTIIDPSSGHSTFPVDRNTYYSATYIEGGQHGLGIMLVPMEDGTGQDKASITWRTRRGEKMGGIVTHEEDNEFSVYVRDGTPYDGTEGQALKFMDLRGGSPGMGRMMRIQNSGRFYWDGKTHGGENRIQFEMSDGQDTYLQFSEDTNGLGAHIWYYGGNQEMALKTAGTTDALYLDSNQNVNVPNGVLRQGGTDVALTSRFPIPNSDLQNASVSVAGNSVSLGGSTAISAHDLSDSGTVGMLDEAESVTSKWTFDSGLGLGGELDANGNALNLDNGDQWITIHDGHGNYNLKSGVDPNNNIVTTAGGTHVQLTESGNIRLMVDDGTATGNAFSADTEVSIGGGVVDVTGTLQQGGTDVALTSRFPLPNSDLSNSSVTVAGNAVSLGGSTAIAHADLSSISSDDHHTKTQPSDIDSSNWNDYELQKNGTDGTGVINFKT